MAVKRYNGSGWDTVAGLGAQGAAATSSSIATWVKTASGGETSLSGNDDNSQPLSYTAGQELVYINGVLQKRAVDYVATTGTTITGLNALAASDVVTVWTVNAFSVTNAIPNSTITAKGDLIVGTGSGTYTAQAVGTNGQVLTANSAQADGVEWATLTAAGYTKIKTGTFSAASDTGTTFDNVFTTTYKNYVVLISTTVSTSDYLVWRFRNAASTMTTGYFGSTAFDTFTGTTNRVNQNNGSAPQINNNGAYPGYNTVNVSGVGNTSERAFMYGNGFSTQQSAFVTFGYQSDNARTYDGFILSSTTGTITGTAIVYGLAN